MKHVFSTSCAVFLSLLLLVTSCKKGDTGPAGADGPAGPAGPAGPQGPKGDAGTANVIYSDWLDVPYEPQKNTDGDTTGYVGVIETDRLDADILASGDVRVYLNWGTSDEPDISPLPFVNPISGLYINPEFVEGGILIFSNGDPSTVVDAGEKYLQHRFIIVPGGEAARSAINWNDYNAVKAYLKLPN